MTFTVQKLPVANRGESQVILSSPIISAPPAGGSMDAPARIVIVEDESIAALHLAKRLHSLGYEVVALANSGPRAIEHALARRPHVVLMDRH
jgi:hypothetical protein